MYACKVTVFPLKLFARTMKSREEKAVEPQDSHCPNIGHACGIDNSPGATEFATMGI